MADASMTTPPLTAARIEEIRGRVEAEKTALDLAVNAPGNEATAKYADARNDLNAHAPADIAALLADNERLRAALEQAERDAMVADDCGRAAMRQYLAEREARAEEHFRADRQSYETAAALGEDSSHG